MEAAERILDQVTVTRPIGKEGSPGAECNAEQLHGTRKPPTGGKGKEGLGKQQVYAHFPTDISWIFAFRNNSITTYVKGL